MNKCKNVTMLECWLLVVVGTHTWMLVIGKSHSLGPSIPTCSLDLCCWSKSYPLGFEVDSWYSLAQTKVNTVYVLVVNTDGPLRKYWVTAFRIKVSFGINAFTTSVL